MVGYFQIIMSASSDSDLPDLMPAHEGGERQTFNPVEGTQPKQAKRGKKHKSRDRNLVEVTRKPDWELEASEYEMIEKFKYGPKSIGSDVTGSIYARFAYLKDRNRKK
jgi:hypothetical protein